MARIAKSLDTLRSQINAIWPDRDKSSDGWIGDVRHQTRASDHNQNSAGVVAAIDFTSDVDGPTGDMIAGAIAASRDNRVKYMIHRNRIMSGNAGSAPWIWRNRNKGPGDHAKHIHISVGRGPDGQTTNPELYDDPRPWAIGAVIEPPPPGNLLFRVKGKMSTFGGPFDTGMTPTEGLALFNTAEEMTWHGIDVLPVRNGVTGLGRRLNPDTYYLACRWDYSKTSKKFLQSARATVAAAGKSIVARPVDWGPNERTGRVADLSPALARDLGLQTDDICEVTIKGDGQRD